MNKPCTCCGAPLFGGTDTFGSIQAPMCQACHLDLWAEAEAAEKQETQERKKRRRLLESDREALHSEIRHIENEIEILVTLDKRGNHAA